MTLGWIRQRVIDWIEDESEYLLLARAINDAVDIIQKAYPFAELNRTVTITPASDGTFDVPPRCLEVLDIYPTSEKIGADFTFKGERRVQSYPRARGYKFQSAGIHEQNLAIVSLDCAVESNVFSEASGTIDSFEASHVGQEIVLRGGSEVYRIDSFTAGVPNEITVFPEYRFNTDTAITAYIRPQGTHILRLYDSNGDPYTMDVDVDYRQKHPLLSQSHDRLLIPAPNIVALTAVRNMLRQTKYDVDARRLDAEYMEYKAIECKQDVQNDSSQGCGDAVFASRTPRGGSRSRSRRAR